MGKTHIDKLCRISTENVKALVKYGQRPENSGRGVTLSLELGGITYQVIYASSYKSEGELFLISWRGYDGEHYTKRVQLARVASNLGKEGESYFYFVCPFTGRRARKIFVDGYNVFSRHALASGYVYSYQVGGRSLTALTKYTRITQEKDPHRKRGKLTYRGKPTRYARDLERYEARQDKANELLVNYLNTQKWGRDILSSF